MSTDENSVDILKDAILQLSEENLSDSPLAQASFFFLLFCLYLSLTLAPLHEFSMHVMLLWEKLLSCPYARLTHGHRNTQSLLFFAPFELHPVGQSEVIVWMVA